MSCKAGQKHHPTRVRQPRLSEDLPGQNRPPLRLDVRLDVPDLSAWYDPPSGVSGVCEFDSGRVGPDVVITAMVHGNEFAGGHALEKIRQACPIPDIGRVTLILANLEAFRAFDPSAPLKSRFVDEDLNRLWHFSALRMKTQCLELDRMKVLLPFIERADLLLDLHSTLWPSGPVFIAPPRKRSTDLACYLASKSKVSGLVVTDLGHHGGARLIEQARFMSTGGTGRACLFEAGLHWNSDTVRVMEMVCRDFLANAVQVHLQSSTNDLSASVAVVTDNITARSGYFEFVEPWVGNTSIAYAGTVIARDGDDLICTPYDDCLLVIPNLRPAQGQLAVRLARHTALPLRR